MMNYKSKGSLLSIIIVAFHRMPQIYRKKNPMFFLVFILSCVALFIFSKEIFYETDNILLYGQITFWLWMTIFLSSFMEAIALAQDENLESQKHQPKHTTVKKLSSLADLDHHIQTDILSVKNGNLILLQNGDEVPFDGEIIKGVCYVNETDITGSLEHRLKSPEKDNTLITGSIIEGNDQIVMKVSSSRSKSFFTRVFRLLENIDRQAMPSEIALQRLTLGLSILFITVIFVIWVIADYSGLKIPTIYLISLVIILLPTAISGLQRAVVYNGWASLSAHDIIVQDQTAFDNAVDINIIFFDKTGTLTIGHRKMIEFVSISKTEEKDYLRYLYLSSLNDTTQEGKSILTFTQNNVHSFNKRVNSKRYEPMLFSASNPISGCDYDNVEIRKGGLKSIAKYLGKTVKTLPKEVTKIATEIARNHGTPMILTYDKKIIGVINLRDGLRKGVTQQIQKIQDTGIITMMLTGDNHLTAAYIANKLGIGAYYANSTPEKKLALIRTFQKKGFVVAMCGDGVNDAPALAQADIGYTFEEEGEVHSVLAGNIIAKHHDLLGLLELKNECRKITTKRSALTVYSVTSDLAKYFVIVPALFTTAFPALSKLNIMQFQSLESVILSSVIFNAVIIPLFAPLIFSKKNLERRKRFLWRTILVYGLGGMISPFLFIKLIEIIIYNLELV